MQTAMKWTLFSLACVALLANVSQAKALMILAPPLAARVALAHTIVAGKVESIEEKTVSAPRFPGDKEKGEYQIAVIKIDDPVLNAKGLTYVRVGFLPAPTGVRRPIGVRPSVSFSKDQEVLVFLKPHFESNFMIVQANYDVINKQGNGNFEKEVAQVKHYLKLLANPKESLTAKNAEDRYTTAALLITQYRNRPQGATEAKTEAVDAPMSKLIMTILAEADWKATPPELARLNPQVLFNQLGVTEQDGWTPPMKELMGRQVVDYQKLPEAAKQWCKDHASNYRIQRFVAKK